ncbi:MAG: PEP-CTERM sorting domain-containing protein [Phycisphaerae bacterium]|nr:PEP-CTERM sorting domain-containing protein [Phycisphaerae bacterium]
MKRIGFVWMVVAAVSAMSSATELQFDFNGDLSASAGPGTLDYFNGATTSGAVSFGTAGSFGLSALSGGDATVMSFAAFQPDQGLQLFPGCGPNGGGSDINQYTMIWDLLIPSFSSSYSSLFNTNPSNGNDGDFFIRENMGIGISGDYTGIINPNEWNRIGVTVDLTTSTMSKYINGVQVGSQILSSGVGGRWALYADGQATLLLADEDGENNAGYINSFYFADRALTSSEMAAFGGPDSDGVIPEPATGLLLITGVSLIAARKRRS